MLAFAIDKTGDTAVLTIKGKLTREFYYDFRETLMIFLGTVEYVVINIGHLPVVDLNYLQGLCSACNMVLTLNKSVILDRDRPDTLDRAVMESGFVCRKDCVMGGNKKCLLLKTGDKNL